MDVQFPFGRRTAAPGEDAAPALDPAAPTGARASLDARTLRAVIGGAAAVAVLGGTGLAFAWLSSTPGGDLPVDNSGVQFVPPALAPTAPASPVAGFSTSGRDPFASALPDLAGAAVPVAGTPADTPAAAGTRRSPLVGSGSLGSTPVRSGTQEPATSTGSPGGTSAGAATTAPTNPAPGPTSSAPAPAPPAPTPTPSRSTAPAWEVSTYTYLGTAGEACGTHNFVVAGDSFLRGYCTTVAPGEDLYPADVVYQGDVGGSAWIVSRRGVPQGWLVPADTTVPEAAMGRTAGTVRVIGVRSTQDYLLQIDRQRTVSVRAGEAVPGTPLTFTGCAHPGMPSGPVYFTDGAGAVYYGAFGAGESDGVTYGKGAQSPTTSTGDRVSPPPSTCGTGSPR